MKKSILIALVALLAFSIYAADSYCHFMATFDDAVENDSNETKDLYFDTNPYKCIKCQGTKEVECSFCNGLGHRDCPFCEKGVRRRSCMKCKGKGRYSVVVALGKERRTENKTCPECRGLGTKRERCSVCYGKGWRECIFCHGYGKEKCNRCDGTGIEPN